MDMIHVIGGGLAGCEAAYQIANRGIQVNLYEMKPLKFSPAHSSEYLAEIVCSNSLKSNLLTNACGLLKEELRRVDSLLIRCADATKVPAGQALAVDREEFSQLVTQEIEKNPNITVIKEEVKTIPEGITIIATRSTYFSYAFRRDFAFDRKGKIVFLRCGSATCHQRVNRYDLCIYSGSIWKRRKRLHQLPHDERGV